MRILGAERDFTVPKETRMPIEDGCTQWALASVNVHQQLIRSAVQL